MSLLLASRPLACTCNFPALLCFIPPPSVTHCLLDPVLLTSPCTCRVLPPVDLVSLLSSAFLIPGLRSVGHRPLLALSAGSLGLIHSAGVVITVRVSYHCCWNVGKRKKEASSGWILKSRKKREREVLNVFIFLSHSTDFAIKRSLFLHQLRSLPCQRVRLASSLKQSFP